MPGYKLTADVNASLDAAAAAHPTLATRHPWDPGHEGKTAGYIQIGATIDRSPNPRWQVLITGGVHARELAPPDALVSFVEKLLTAYATNTDVTYPSFTTPDGVVYDAFTVSLAEVRIVMERIQLFVAPLVNADGRDFVLAPLPATATADEKKLHKEWRKNRSPALLTPASVPTPTPRQIALSAGIDVNRNFDILFKFEDHYDPAAVADVQTSTNPIAPTFSGLTAESEPETHNVAELFRNLDIGFFLDIHQYGRTVMWSWGVEENQNADPTQSFMNTATWDHRRDGVGNKAYGEYIPASQERAAKNLARKMARDIETRAGGSHPVAVDRSKYLPQPSSALYVTTGTTDDYCFSRWFTEAAVGRPIRPIVALVVEAGDDKRNGVDHDDGGFWPDFTAAYPKVEREIHAAIWTFLAGAAATPVSDPKAPPGPGDDSTCLVATTVYHDGGHPSVVFLRDVRDRQLVATGAGRRFAAHLNRRYYQASPPMAGWLARHPAAERVTRHLLEPSVQGLRAVSARTARFPRARSIVLSGALATTVWPIITVARAWHRAVTAIERRLGPGLDGFDAHGES